MDIFQIIILGTILIILNSFVKTNKFLSTLTSIILSIIFTIQLGSLIITGKVADYKFYENFSFKDIWSVRHFFAKEGVFIIISLITAIFLIHFFSKKWRKNKLDKKVSFTIFSLGVILLSLNGGIISNYYNTLKLKLTYASGTFNDALSALNIDNSKYVKPNNIKALKGKNIIVLSLESFEKAYLSEKLKQLTPNLRQLAQENFLYTMQQCPGGGWTSASIYTTITGVPALFGMDGNKIFQSAYENKLTTLSLVLKAAGYDIEYLIGDKEFSGINDMLTTLGFKVKSEKDFEEKYKKTPWGIHDKDLFNEIKKELLKRKKSNKPFALFASTISTHFPNGKMDERMKLFLPPQKSNLEFMVSAVDYFIGDLMDFLKRESMLSNTVFYIFPDHLLMGNKSRVLKDFNERELFILTNSKIDIKGKNLFQIDLPRIIIDGAKIKTNAKFLTDFIINKDKIKYLKKNGRNIVRLNKVSLKTLNCKNGVYIALRDSTDLEIKNKNNQTVFSFKGFRKGLIHQIKFDKQMRVVTCKVLKTDDELTQEDTNTKSLILISQKGFLYGQLKQGDNFGIIKKAKEELSFSKKDIELLDEFSEIKIPKKSIVINSFSWNAKKRSSIKILNKINYLNRGLSVIKIYNESNYEIKTFDTYGDIMEVQKFVNYIKKLKKSNVFYIVVGHDSVEKYLIKFSKELNYLGFKKLISIKKRQAYVMYQRKGKIVEEINDMSITKNLILKNYPRIFNNHSIAEKHKIKEKAYNISNKIINKFEVNRFIAHAGGAIDNFTYTDSKNALDASYKKGFRLFELDIIQTKEGDFVAAHDWNNWVGQTRFKGKIPPTSKEFMSHKIKGNYNPLDMKGVNKWFSEHKDAVLITDKVNEPLIFSEKFIDKKRLRMELFTLAKVHEALKNNIIPIISERTLMKIKGDKVAYLKKFKIKYVSISRKNIVKLKPLLLDLNKNNIKVYVYNLDREKNEKYVLENEIGIIYGMYADKWVFNKK